MNDPCDVYWGSHGCKLGRGHDGAHWCTCCDCAHHPDENPRCVGGPPYYGPDTEFYGEDARLITEADHQRLTASAHNMKATDE